MKKLTGREGKMEIPEGRGAFFVRISNLEEGGERRRK